MRNFLPDRQKKGLPAHWRPPAFKARCVSTRRKPHCFTDVSRVLETETIIKELVVYLCRYYVFNYGHEYTYR